MPSSDLDSLDYNHVIWSGEEAGKPAEKTGVHDQGPKVGVKLGKLTGKFVYSK